MKNVLLDQKAISLTARYPKNKPTLESEFSDFQADSINALLNLTDDV